MRYLFVFLGFATLFSCRSKQGNETVADRSQAVVAEEFIRAFYSFNGDSLAQSMFQAKGSQPNILYYQKWAECGHYKVLRRGSYVEKNDSTVVLPVTVKDDLMATLGIDFNVTDTFSITIKDGHIRSVTNSSNDPEEYYQAKAWVKENRPGLIDKACEGIWNGGPTPCECIRGMLKGFADYKLLKNGNVPPSK